METNEAMLRSSSTIRIFSAMRLHRSRRVRRDQCLIENDRPASGHCGQLVLLLPPLPFRLQPLDVQEDEPDPLIYPVPDAVVLVEIPQAAVIRTFQDVHTRLLMPLPLKYTTPSFVHVR